VSGSSAMKVVQLDRIRFLVDEEGGEWVGAIGVDLRYESISSGISPDLRSDSELTNEHDSISKLLTQSTSMSSLVLKSSLYIFILCPYGIND